MKNSIFFLLLLALCLSSCTTPTAGILSTPTAPAADPLAGTEWILTSMQGQPPLQEPWVTLSFWDGRAGGLASCNSYGGRYQLDGSKLKLDEVALTAMACEEQELMQQEERYMTLFTDLLVKTASPFVIIEDSTGTRLEIRDALGVPVLVYMKKFPLAMNPVDLIGTGWRLEAWEHAQVVSNPPPDTNPTLYFLNVREFIGFAGCRAYYGTYTAPGGDDIRVSSTFMIGLDCHENEELNLQESNFTDLLSRATDFSLNEEKTRLDLLTAQGSTATFAPVGEQQGIEDRAWRFAALLEPPADPANPRLPLEPLLGTEITLSLSNEHYNGNAGCNQYSGVYTMEGTRITFTPPAATRKFCAEPPDLMQQEQRYLQAIEKVKSFVLFENLLLLETDTGQTLIFTQSLHN